MSVPQRLRFWLLPVILGLCLGFLALFLVQTGHREQAPLPMPAPSPLSYADAINRAQHSVVSIYTNSRIYQPAHPLFEDPFFSQFLPQQPRFQSSLGAAIVIDDQGHLLTNRHIIADAEEIIVVSYEQSEQEARLIGQDIESDLAVLKIENTTLPAIPTDIDYRAQVGDLVFAIGNPFGVGQTVSMGIVSATGRHQPGLTQFTDFIQTDAAINPGNSGGALINARGDWVGINTAIVSQTGGYQGIGFAIPYAHAIDIARQIITQGAVIRGYLGLDVRILSPRQQAELGLPIKAFEIIDIRSDSPAEQAGLEVGDLILTINEQALGSREAAVTVIARHQPGEELHLRVLRSETPLQIRVQLGERPDQ